MGKNVEHIQHIKSNVVLDNGKPKLPQSGVLVEGELAVNYAKDVETISLENASGEVVTFSSDKYYTEQKLGSAFTGANSAVTVTDVIEENEEIISSALNDLETRKLDTSAYTPTEELWVSGTGLNSVVLKGSSGTASGDYSLAEGYSFEYNGETYASIASGSYSHTEGVGTSASSMSSHADGVLTTASGPAAHAEGLQTLASGESSHAKGAGTSATSYFSHAEGADTIASGDCSHAEGTGTTASGRYSHAEGTGTTASGQSSHAEGYRTLASGSVSHAEGISTEAIGEGSHAEGNDTKASGDCSHAEGSLTVSNGLFSHAEGEMTITSNRAEHASGWFNVSNSASTDIGDSGNTLFSVGNGNITNGRHNAFEIRQNGDIYIANTNASGDYYEKPMIKLQDSLGGGSGIVDQVLDDTTSASTNAVSSKAVYKAVTDNELVWTNAFVTLSGTVSAHTANTEIHVTAADKEKLHTHSNKSALDSITGNVGTMAYENTSSYSSATQVSTALQGKSNANHNQGANTITAMTGYQTASTVSAISTSDTLNQAMAKLEARFDGIRLLKISQTDYDNLQTKDPNTLYVITD